MQNISEGVGEDFIMEKKNVQQKAELEPMFQNLKKLLSNVQK